MKVTLYPKYLIRSLSARGRQSFFSAGYLLLYPECVKRGMTPWQHYMLEGRRKGYDDGNHPSDNVFFPDGYELEYPDVKAAGEDPWRHYVLHGKKEGRDNGLHPSEKLFFPEGYLEMYPDVAKTKADPWRHYVLRGKKAGRDNGLHPSEKQFFAEGYLAMYPDVAKAKVDPWRHYVMHVRNEGRNSGLHPSDRQFFAEGYLAMYPDVAASGMDPWRHYVLHGKKEGRDSGLHPDKKLFFPEGYLLMYPDAAESGLDAWHHYVLHGKKEGRDSGLHPDRNIFYPAGYLEMYPDVARAKADPWRHYVLRGTKERRDNAVIKQLTTLKKPFSQRKYKILLISPKVEWSGITIWRMSFLKEFLENHLGAEAYVECRPALSLSFIDRIQECRCVIMSRPKNDMCFDAIYQYCRNNGLKIFIDLDDLLLPGYAAFELGGLRSKQNCVSVGGFWKSYLMKRVHECLPYAAVDGLICSTRKIADLFGALLHVPAHVHPNLISRSLFDGIPRQIADYPDLKKQKFSRNDAFRLHLLIADGSSTHMYDLSTVVLELLAFLKKNPDVQLTLLGSGWAGTNFLKKSLGSQLCIIPRVSYTDMLYVYSLNDILIVPLNSDVFNECKSNIKFIEAATVGKPCLVKDIPEFSKDITDGKNGLLYKDPADFMKKLDWVYEHAGLLPSIGEEAHKYVSGNLTTDRQDKADTDFFADLLR